MNFNEMEMFTVAEQLTKTLNVEILERLQTVGLRPDFDPLECIAGLDAEVTRLETSIELIRLLIQRYCQCNDLEIDNGVVKSVAGTESSPKAEHGQSPCKDPSKHIRIRCLSDFY